MLKSIITAFGMYSRLPVPRIEFDEKSMKYTMCCFPLVGVFIAALEAAWIYLAMTMYPVPQILKGAVACVIPILVTGGIHMDGFCDTTDALSSYQTKEKKLEIMKDSAAGVFALTYACVFFIVYFACWCCISERQSVLAVSLGFVSSRALSGLALIIFNSARENGMLRTVAAAADKKLNIIVLCVWLVLTLAAQLFFSGIRGVFVFAAQLFVFFYYRHTAYKHFGGTTGDIAGWFTQLAELAALIVPVFWEVFL